MLKVLNFFIFLKKKLKNHWNEQVRGKKGRREGKKKKKSKRKGWMDGFNGGRKTYGWVRILMERNKNVDMSLGMQKKYSTKKVKQPYM